MSHSLLLLAFSETDVKIAAVIAFAVLALLSPILLRRRKHQELPKPPGRNHDDQKRLRDSADKALVDLLETGREISAQIDTKIRVLNKLVKDADDHARRLEKLLGIEPDLSKEKPKNADKSTGDTYSRSKQSLHLNTGSDIVREKTKSGRFASDLNSRIKNLHSAGKSAAEIARQTRLSLQEVNLALHVIENIDNTVPEE